MPDLPAPLPPERSAPPVLSPSPAHAHRRDGPIRTIVVSLLVCLGCSIIVSISTVLLRPLRAEHARQARQGRIDEALAAQPGLSGLLDELPSVDLELWVVELATGTRSSEIDPSTFDPERAATDPAAGRLVPVERDIARIKHQARHGVVTVVRRGGKLEALVLPVYGRGYASVIHASVALAPDGRTIQALIVQEHGETAGIGTQIEDPEWLGQWSGKQALDEQGRPVIEVATGKSADDEPGRVRIDAVSGATRSSVGVGNMIRFWLGEDGYGPFIARVREGELR